MAWPFVTGSVPLKLVLALWIVGFSMLGLAKFRQSLEDRNRYDLKALKRVHAREAEAKQRVPEITSESDHAYCLKCGEVFDGNIPICPKCKSPQGAGPILS